MSMSAHREQITANKCATTMLAPSLVPVIMATHWERMDIPVQWFVEVPSLEAVVVSRVQDGQMAIHRKTSSVNGSLIFQTVMQTFSSPLIVLMASGGGPLVLLTTFSFLMALPAILFLFTNFASLTILVPLLPQHLIQEWCLLALSNEIVQPAVLEWKLNMKASNSNYYIILVWTYELAFLNHTCMHLEVSAVYRYLKSG